MEQQKLPILGELVGRMSAEMFRTLKKRAEKQLDIDISVEQFGLLYAVNSRKDDVIQQDMADYIGKDKTTILRLIDSLENKELLRRVADHKDRRKNYLTVTKKGKTLITAYLKIEFQLIKELLEGLSQTEIDCFCKVANHIKNRSQEL